MIHKIVSRRYQVTETCLLAKKILLPRIDPRSRKDTGFGTDLEVLVLIQRRLSGQFQSEAS